MGAKTDVIQFFVDLIACVRPAIAAFILACFTWTIAIVAAGAPAATTIKFLITMCVTITFGGACQGN